jgi:Glycogen recognition site of AMP-activated protein kinase
VTGTSRRISLLILLALVALAPAARSQEWRASARIGRVTYDGAPIGASGASSVVLGVGRTTPRDWLGASAALPLGEDPFWAVLGGWKRLETRSTVGALLDLSAQGFIQRQTVTATVAPSQGPLPGPFQQPTVTRTDLSGEGVSGELMAGLYVGPTSVRFETRGGVAGQRSSLGESLQQRMLPTGDARLTLISAPLTRAQCTVQGEMRGWLDDSVTHVYAGGTLQLLRGPLRLQSSLGQWVSGGHDGVAWSIGGAAALSPQMELQIGGRGNAFDPLYLTATATSFWGGLSLRIGGGRPVQAPVQARNRNGQAVIRIPVRSAKGAPSIAGDFTGWKPMPMEHDGSSWSFTAPLSPGVYHYAFVAEDGTWFVPASVPGRQSDGMGGQVAVLVVQ